MNFDVIVIGGGTSGVIAAIQAARIGAKTLLVEKNGLLGGTITTAGVAFPGLFHAWGKQVIGGIGWELVTQCVKETGCSLPNFSEPDKPHSAYQVHIDPFVYAALCCQAVNNSGCELLFHTMVANVQRISEFWKIDLCTKTGIKSFEARSLIDCTGDANVANLAGAPLCEIENPQPATLITKVSGYNFDSLDINSINKAFDKEVQAGHLSYTDVSWDKESAQVGSWLSKHGDNANHFDTVNAQTSEGRTKLECHAQNSFLRLYQFLKRQKGLEKLRINYVAQECGIRETVTVEGEETISVNDYVSGRLWDDAVCYAFYPIDLHEFSGKGLNYRQLEDGVVPTIPRGALLPKGCGSLIVAGRCISSDRLANSALRVQATCMATGQVAGVLAAISASSNKDPRNILHSTVCSYLKDYKAIVP